jgi:hypothetical protein
MRENDKPPAHWEPNPRYEQPQTVEEWDWRQDGCASENSFDRSWKRLTYAYVRADPHAPDQMSLVLRVDLGRILGRLTHYTAHRELLMEQKSAALTPSALSVPVGDDLAKGLRTSQKALDEIARQEQANIAGYLALRDFPVGSASGHFPPDEVGPNALGSDIPSIAAQLLEISRISNKYDLRECIEGHDDALGDSYIWRDLMDQCEKLGTNPSALSGDAGVGLTDSLETWGQRVTAWIDEFGYDALERELCASRNTLMIWTTGRSMPRPFARQGLVRTINEFRAALPSHQGAGEP